MNANFKLQHAPMERTAEIQTAPTGVPVEAAMALLKTDTAADVGVITLE